MDVSKREDTLRPLMDWPRPLSWALSSATVSCAGARLAAGSGAQWLLNTCAPEHMESLSLSFQLPSHMATPEMTQLSISVHAALTVSCFSVLQLAASTLTEKSVLGKHGVHRMLNGVMIAPVSPTWVNE